MHAPPSNSQHSSIPSHHLIIIIIIIIIELSIELRGDAADCADPEAGGGEGGGGEGARSERGAERVRYITAVLSYVVHLK